MDDDDQVASLAKRMRIEEDPEEVVAVRLGLGAPLVRAHKRYLIAKFPVLQTQATGSSDQSPIEIPHTDVMWTQAQVLRDRLDAMLPAQWSASPETALADDTRPQMAALAFMIRTWHWQTNTLYTYVRQHMLPIDEKGVVARTLVQAPHPQQTLSLTARDFLAVLLAINDFLGGPLPAGSQARYLTSKRYLQDWQATIALLWGATLTREPKEWPEEIPQSLLPGEDSPQAPIIRVQDASSAWSSYLPLFISDQRLFVEEKVDEKAKGETGESVQGGIDEKAQELVDEKVGESHQYETRLRLVDGKALPLLPKIATTPYQSARDDRTQYTGLLMWSWLFSAPGQEGASSPRIPSLLSLFLTDMAMSILARTWRRQPNTMINAHTQRMLSPRTLTSNHGWLYVPMHASGRTLLRQSILKATSELYPVLHPPAAAAVPLRQWGNALLTLAVVLAGYGGVPAKIDFDVAFRRYMIEHPLPATPTANIRAGRRRAYERFRSQERRHLASYGAARDLGWLPPAERRGGLDEIPLLLEPWHLAFGTPPGQSSTVPYLLSPQSFIAASSPESLQAAKGWIRPRLGLLGTQRLFDRLQFVEDDFDMVGVQHTLRRLVLGESELRGTRQGQWVAARSLFSVLTGGVRQLSLAKSAARGGAWVQTALSRLDAIWAACLWSRGHQPLPTQLLSAAAVQPWTNSPGSDLLGLLAAPAADAKQSQWPNNLWQSLVGGLGTHVAGAKVIMDYATFVAQGLPLIQGIWHLLDKWLGLGRSEELRQNVTQLLAKGTRKWTVVLVAGATSEEAKELKSTWVTQIQTKQLPLVVNTKVHWKRGISARVVFTDQLPTNPQY